MGWSGLVWTGLRPVFIKDRMRVGMVPLSTLAKHRSIARVGSYRSLSHYKPKTPQYKLIENPGGDSMWWKCDFPMDKLHRIQVLWCLVM